MIAKTEICSDRERILALLAAHRSDACVRQLFADLDEIDRLMEYYSFRTPQLADRFIEKLESRYRYEIFAIYGSSLLLRKSSDSSYMRLDQLFSSLIRVAILRLCAEGVYTLSHTQLASGDGLLFLALQNRRFNSKNRKFSHSFIGGKGYSPPPWGRIAFCLHSKRG